MYNTRELTGNGFEWWLTTTEDHNTAVGNHTIYYNDIRTRTYTNRYT